MIRYFWSVVFASAVLLCGCTRIELAGISDVVYLDIPVFYTKVDVRAGLEVRFSESCPSPQLEADVNAIPYIEIYERNGVLHVNLESGFKLDDKDWNMFKAVVTLPAKSDIESLYLSGACSFISDVPFRSESFRLTASGASRFIGQIETGSLDVDLSGASLVECGSVTCENLTFTASGASAVKMSGRVNTCLMELSGASCLEGITGTQSYTLEIDRCSGSLSGASCAAFRSDGKIDCILRDASLLYYSGDADISGSKVSDGSSIICEDK